MSEKIQWARFHDRRDVVGVEADVAQRVGPVGRQLREVDVRREVARRLLVDVARVVVVLDGEGRQRVEALEHDGRPAVRAGQRLAGPARLRRLARDAGAARPALADLVGARRARRAVGALEHVLAVAHVEAQGPGPAGEDVELRRERGLERDERLEVLAVLLDEAHGRVGVEGHVVDVRPRPRGLGLERVGRLDLDLLLLEDARRLRLQVLVGCRWGGILAS